MDSLVQRLVQNPHDQDAILYAHQAGQSDPRSYAMLLEKTGTATSDPALASHWLTEAANVWATTLGDAHRAARALMIAIDRDPTQPTPAERLADLYREKGDTKALAALLERRSKALAPLAQQDPQMRAHVAGIHEELGRLWAAAPLGQPRKAVENYRRALEYDPQSQYAIYELRELFKSQQQWAEAVPYFQMEQDLVEDPARKIALFVDEADVRKSAGDGAGATEALRSARSYDGGQDPALTQQLGSLVLERIQGGERVSDADRAEAADLFVSLAEQYAGEHGLSYSRCAVEAYPSNDRAVQLAMYYAAELGREAEVVVSATAYLEANPGGVMAADAQALVARNGGPVSPAAPAARPRSAAPAAQAPAPALEADPEGAVSLVDEAAAFVKRGKKQEAAAKYREALQIDPANEEAITFLETYLKQTRKYAELRDVLLAAARVSDILDDQRREWLKAVAALCETQLRDVDTAVVALRELVQLDPGDDATRAQLRRILERSGKWDDLASVIQQEADQATDVEIRLALEKELAKLHEVKRKDPIGAGEAWARIAGLTPDDETAIQTAVRLFERGERLDLAAQVIGNNVSSVQDDRAKPALYKKLGELREATGETLAAGEAYADGAGASSDPQLWEAAERCFASAEAWDQAATAADARAQLAASDSEKARLFAQEADYLVKAGDDSSAVLRLEQAAELDPKSQDLADRLEGNYEAAERFGDLAAYLLKRAAKVPDKALRISLRKRAATLHRETLTDEVGAREALKLVLEDGDDVEALSALADDAEVSGDLQDAVDLLRRLAKATPEPAEQAKITLREAGILAEGLNDPDAAIERYEAILAKLDPKSEASLERIAALHEQKGDAKGTADALERHLKIAATRETKLDLARRLATLYEGTLDDPKAAMRALDVVRELDPEDFDAVQRLSDLAEKAEEWPIYAKHLAALLEVEGDEDEVSRMTRRLAEVLHEKCGKGDEAMAALAAVADDGDGPCREDYVKLGDELGWKGIVAQKLVEWFEAAPVGAERHEALRGAFGRFVEIGRNGDAAAVGKELARTRGATPEICERLETIATELKDLDALGAAHDLLVQDLSGPSRAEEMVRQAEVLVKAGVDPAEAIQHGEQALTSVAPDEVGALLERLGALAAAPGHVVDIYERQVGRCKAPADRLRALARAAQVAADKEALDRARGFFDIALGGGVQEETLEALEGVARDGDAARGEQKLRRILAEALAAGGQGSRDGGRTRSALLRRAAMLAFRDLEDTERAFGWLREALVTHVDDSGLDALEQLADEVGAPARASEVLGKALEEVFDGPLVRKLLARRASIRRDKLEDRRGAAEDLKRLHDLSPGDAEVMDQLSALYVELEDYRGMVQLYEDQILRGRDAGLRVDLARKVARLWEEQLRDPREAADAWRRVLRMKSGDPEATEGLERAKQNMLSAPKDEPSRAPAPAQKAPTEAKAATPAPPRSAPPPPSSRSAAPPPAAAVDDVDGDEAQEHPTIPPAPPSDLEESTITQPHQGLLHSDDADYDPDRTAPGASAGEEAKSERSSDATEVRPLAAEVPADPDSGAEDVDDEDLLVDEDELLEEEPT